jgi:FAD/FMN-containing dehydrogenase
VFRTDPVACEVYSESAGVGRMIPRAVAVPADADDVVTLVRWAAADRIALTARGSGSSMGNGALSDSVIVDLGQLDAIGHPDRHASTIVCGPGALRDVVDDRARTVGLTFVVDPSSGAFCTVGGMCATNAAGARSVHFGATRMWVNALDCVFADGTRAWVRRGAPLPILPAITRFQEQVAPRIPAALPALTHGGVRKESSGYALAAAQRSGDLLDVLIGSEGTLALFVGIELALIPIARASASVLAAFGALEHAVGAATQATALGATAVELLDRTFLDVVRSGTTLEIPAAAEAALIIELQGESYGLVHEQMTRVARLCQDHAAMHVALADSDGAENRMWAIRHAASPILSRLDPHLASLQLVEDGAVAPELFPQYVRGVRDIFARHGVRCVIFGHAGDAHAHVNAMVDVREPDWRARCDRILTEVTALVAELGGTITAEHGDGRLRAPFLPLVWSSDAMALFGATKAAFDPDGILNPGVILPLAGQAPLADIRYDPSLQPLSVEAREALDTIVRERAWGRYRLSTVPRAD